MVWGDSLHTLLPVHTINYHILVKMNAFLKKTKLLPESADAKKRLCIVMGSGSDLDSVCSSIVLAFFYSRNRNRPIWLKGMFVMPVLNINRGDFELKTEVLYFLNLHGIDGEDILCRDELPETIMEESTYILVDHHLSQYQSQAIQIIDHHERNKNFQLPNKDCLIRIKKTGSCASLIADCILNSKNSRLKVIERNEAIELLYGPIIYDTLNLAPAKTSSLDKKIVEQIEYLLDITDVQRCNLYADLRNTTLDYISFDTYNLLQRDLIVVTDIYGYYKIPVAVLPTMSAEEYTQMPNINKSIAEFHKTYNCIMLIIMGHEMLDGELIKDFVIANFNLNSNKHFDMLIERLIGEPSLGVLGVVMSIDMGCLSKQGTHSLKVSRKEFLPVVQTFLDDISIEQENQDNT